MGGRGQLWLMGDVAPAPHRIRQGDICQLLREVPSRRQPEAMQLMAVAGAVTRGRSWPSEVGA